MSATAIEAGAPGADARRAVITRNARRALVVICAVALVVRLGVVFATPHFVPATDSADYDRTAVYLVHHGGFPVTGLAPEPGPTAFRTPVFPLVLAGVYALSGTGDAHARWRAGRLAEAILGVIAVALIYLIAVRLWGPLTAAVAGAITAVYPPLVLVGSSLMSESVFIPLVLGAVWCALRARGGPARGRWSAAAGVLIGISALSRGNGFVLVLPLGFLVWDLRPRFSPAALRSPAILVAATVLTLAPWTIRNIHVFHRLVPISTESGYAIAGTYNAEAQSRTDFPAMWIPPLAAERQVFLAHPHANEAEVSSRLDTIGFDYITAHPVSLARTGFWNTLRLLNLTGLGLERVASVGEAYPLSLAELSVYAFWVTGLVALGGAMTPAARRVPWALWGCPLVIFLSSVFLIGTTRYRSPADPFVVMLAALGLVEAWGRWQARAASG